MFPLASNISFCLFVYLSSLTLVYSALVHLGYDRGTMNQIWILGMILIVGVFIGIFYYFYRDNPDQRKKGSKDPKIEVGVDEKNTTSTQTGDKVPFACKEVDYCRCTRHEIGVGSKRLPGIQSDSYLN
ncbi:hypothetical protein RF11_00028 [Thelohanellus kitauei]|uniref:Uncharacterized protein n=1 Tax=Thelohanellus kitauei TaxID=669202 RepID=A0A0C2J8A3_THEKT|nr:hypothetical protein RF11_00028 [Thelohanellus kitauei]